jgi:hypothetical protein
MDCTGDNLLWDINEEAENDSPESQMTTLSTEKFWTYLASSLPWTTNVMILQDFKYISKLFYFIMVLCISLRSLFMIFYDSAIVIFAEIYDNMIIARF